MKLRQYQTDTISDLRASILKGNRQIIIQAPCGAGKTIVAAAIIKSALKKGKKIVFLVHFRQLAYQAIERFKNFGMGDQVGVIMAGEMPALDRPVQVISTQTYGKRLALIEDLKLNKWFKQADIVFYDEAHSSVAKTRKAILDLYKDTSLTIGLTATPCRSDGRPLGSIYTDIVTCSSISQLTTEGHLVPVIYYGAKHLPDLKNIKIVAGDYNQKELGKRVIKPKLVGDILENWLRIASNRQTIIFATNVKHSKYIKELLKENGIAIAHVDAHTPANKRQDVLNRLKIGELQVVTNVGVYSEGADFPWVSCIILAKPTKSFARYMQMAGRGLRPWPDKKDCILIDHTGAVKEHGFLDEDMDWTLEGKEKAWKKPKPLKTKEKVTMTCDECRAIFTGNRCPRCGLKVKFYTKKVAVAEAKLEQLTRGKVKKAKVKKTYSFAEKRYFYGQLKQYRIDKDYQEGWIANMYRKKFGVWPVSQVVSGVGAILPDRAFKNYITYLNIKHSAWRKKGRR